MRLTKITMAAGVAMTVLAYTAFVLADRGNGRVEPGKAPDVQGRITAIAENGKTLTLETFVARGEEPKKSEIKLGDATKIEFGGALKDVVKKLKVGDSAAIWLQDGSKDTAATVRASRGPDFTSKITAMSADEKVLTLTVPGRTRGEVEQIEVKITDTTKQEGGRGAPLKPKTGYMASVWLQEGTKDTAAVLQISPPRADVGGTISAISEDGKVLTITARGRGGDGTKSEVKLTDATKIEFTGGESPDKKLKTGYAVTIWLQEGSKDTAGVVVANLQRRSPDVAGKITAVSADGKTITLESGNRSGVTTKTDIKLTDKTVLEFPGIDKADEKKLTVGYSGSVWLQEGSKDTAATVSAGKPGRGDR